MRGDEDSMRIGDVASFREGGHRLTVGSTLLAVTHQNLGYMTRAPTSTGRWLEGDV